ncbi:hypothetical protein [Paraburkholderia phytofirmans]|nr:hypothetical protein [Paraburkholderia phytofirmans]
MLSIKLAPYDQFVAGQRGLNVTDLKCLEVAYYDEVQPVTSGWRSKNRNLVDFDDTFDSRELQSLENCLCGMVKIIDNYMANNRPDNANKRNAAT